LNKKHQTLLSNIHSLTMSAAAAAAAAAAASL